MYKNREKKEAKASFQLGPIDKGAVKKKYQKYATETERLDRQIERQREDSSHVASISKIFSTDDFQ